MPLYGRGHFRVPSPRGSHPAAKADAVDCAVALRLILHAPLGRLRGQLADAADERAVDLHRRVGRSVDHRHQRSFVLTISQPDEAEDDDVLRLKDVEVHRCVRSTSHLPAPEWREVHVQHGQDTCLVIGNLDLAVIGRIRIVRVPRVNVERIPAWIEVIE